MSVPPGWFRGRSPGRVVVKGTGCQVVPPSVVASRKRTSAAGSVSHHSAQRSRASPEAVSSGGRASVAVVAVAIPENQAVRPCRGRTGTARAMLFAAATRGADPDRQPRTGWTELPSTTRNESVVGSSTSEVPVNPVWPAVRGVAMAPMYQCW